MFTWSPALAFTWSLALVACLVVHLVAWLPRRLVAYLVALVLRYAAQSQVGNAWLRRFPYVFSVICLHFMLDALSALDLWLVASYALLHSISIRKHRND